MANQNVIVRITGILDALGIAHSSWYLKFVPASERKRPGPVRKPIGPEIERIVIYYATSYPWYGYKKIAVICRRAGHKVKNRQAWRVMDEHNLLHKQRNSTGLSRSACGGQVPTSFCEAHSHPSADPSDTALEPSRNKR